MYINKNLKPGDFEHIVVESGLSKKPCHKYSYRHPDGTLFHCVGVSLADCQSKVRIWKTEYDARISKTREVGLL